MTSPFTGKSMDEIRMTWQGRVLAASKEKIRMVLQAVFANEYAGHFTLLWRSVHREGFTDVPLPMISSYATITKTGCVVADVTRGAGRDVIRGPLVIYENEGDFISDMRKLADKTKLSDADRIEMFALLQKWVSADRRVDHEGRNLAS